MNNTTNTMLSPQEWNELYDTDYETWQSLYLEFMYNRENIGHCERCPENGEYDCIYHCGQQFCWVRVHAE